MFNRSVTLPVVTGKPKQRSMLVALIIRLLREKPLGTFGAVVFLLFLFMGIFADQLAPYGKNDIHPGSFLKPSSARFLLGTDNLGRDLLSRIIFGARVSVVVSMSGTLLATFVAMIIGLISGFYGGKIDIVIQRFVDAVMCFPWLFLVLGIMAIIGPGLLQVILTLGVLYGIRNSRIIRSAVIGIRENMYIEAARVVGCSSIQILVGHILPNVMAPIIIIFTIGVGYMIMTEATLSFIGFGIPPPEPSWGGMLTVAGRRYMVIAPSLAIWPGIALSVVVFSINMLGDAVRDILDPRLKGAVGRFGKIKEGKKR
ncbi:MAG: ABC transporter permease [Candidatus Tectomicrobia bacterium]|uniref:ABC transporter permease n=1 Tax=Tectimicrobiota bacterium TaxID=2528274 RepID=A0A933GMC1_UNCTE|nr:ABC transporter permease [Candidatus Tectomicrobia bacterium]